MISTWVLLFLIHGYSDGVAATLPMKDEATCIKVSQTWNAKDYGRFKGSTICLNTETGEFK